MKRTILTTVALSAALIATSAFAQMGPGGGMGRFAWNKDFTPGWTLMTSDERSAWQAQMRAVKTYDECKATQDAHLAVMEERAKEKGLKFVPARQNGCETMKARGLIQ